MSCNQAVLNADKVSVIHSSSVATLSWSVLLWIQKESEEQKAWVKTRTQNRMAVRHIAPGTHIHI